MSEPDHPQSAAKSPLSPEMEEFLAYRLMGRSLKYLLSVLGVVTAILSYIGFDLISDINKSKAELEEKARQAGALIQRLDEKVAALETQIRLNESYLQQVRDIINENQQTLMHNLTQLGGNTRESRLYIEQMNRMMQTVDARLDSLRRLENRTRQQQEAFHRTLAEQNRQLQAFQERLDSMEAEVFQSGDFVITENNETILYGLNLLVKVGIIRTRKLHRFQLLEANTGRVLFGPKQVSLGKEIQITDGARIIHVVPRHAMNLIAEKDIAWIHVRIRSSQ